MDRPWREICDRLARHFGGVGAVLMPFEKRARARNMVGSAALSKVQIAYVEEGWAREDPRERLWPVMMDRGFATDEDLPSKTLHREHPFFTDFLARFSLGGFLGLHIRIEGQDYCAAIPMPPGRIGPDPAACKDIPAIRALLAETALRRVQDMRRRRDAFLAMLEGFGIAYVALDLEGAEVLKSEEFPAVTVGGRNFPALFDPREAPEIRRWLAGGPLPPPTTLRAADDEPRPVRFAHCPEGLSHFCDPVRGFMILSDARRHLDAVELFARRFELTLAETRALGGLVEGLSIAAIAARHGLAEGTVRQQLKSVYRKSGTGSQHQLVAFTLRGI